jgi:hypothetical protein
MRKPVLAALLCCWLLMGAAPTDSKVELITKISADELIAVLKEEGFSAKSDRPEVVAVKVEGLNVLFVLPEDHYSVQAYAGFKSDKGTLSRVNEWNRTHRFSRAYIDNDGDPVIELDLDLTGGISKQRLVDYIKTVRISVLAYARHVLME